LRERGRDGSLNLSYTGFPSKQLHDDQVHDHVAHGSEKPNAGPGEGRITAREGKEWGLGVGEPASGGGGNSHRARWATQALYQPVTVGSLGATLSPVHQPFSIKGEVIPRVAID
jgi:hypothetical protein